MYWGNCWNITEMFFSRMCNEQHDQHCQGDRDIVMMQLIGSTQIYEKQVIYNEK